MSKKREARIARQLEKELRDREKSARLRDLPEAISVRSNHKQENIPEVRAGANPGSIFQMQMQWTIEFADREGAWSWDQSRDWTDETWKTELHPKLEQFEKLTWAEIESQAYGNPGKRHRSHHSMETDQVCDEAQVRLLEIERDSELLFRFRLGNLPRLWGVRVVNSFEVLWYDPTHRIYPLD